MFGGLRAASSPMQVLGAQRDLMVMVDASADRPIVRPRRDRFASFEERR